jgi:predicted Zn-dependent protease
MRAQFEELTRKILKTRRAGEHFLFSLSGERSQFTRINASKVRQTGSIEDAVLEITLLLETPGANEPQLRRASRSFTLSGLSWQDWERTQAALETLRSEVPGLPLDEFAEIPANAEMGVFESQGELLDSKEVNSKVLCKMAQSMDIAGIYAAGPMYRGMANSAGQMLWFSTETFSFDFSVYTLEHRALKSSYAGKSWSEADYESELQKAREQLTVLERPAKTLKRGNYRTYLAPAALNDIVTMLSWGCMSEASVQQGDSPLRLVRSGEQSFSPLFSLDEDFSAGQTPRFNDLGEVAPECLILVEKGKLKNTLISSRTAKEYKLEGNAAVSAETLRSPAVHSGNLKEAEILGALGTGLYLSNLHYLNWSDQTGGRITGMTRYACFWVENGKTVSPIENMRWDDSIFRLLGSQLEALTQTRRYIADVGTYERRELGGILTPGALVSEMAFTL